MHLLPTAEFLDWAAEHGIGWDPRYPRANQLTFLAAPAHWRAWDSPEDRKHLAWFAEAVLRVAAHEADAFLLFPRREGRWRFGGDATPVPNQALDLVVRGMGVPVDFSGAVQFDASEFAHVLVLTVASLVLGWGIGEDFYILPSTGNCILLSSHDCSFIGSFPSEADLQSFASKLREHGYEDPDVAPVVPAERS